MKKWVYLILLCLCACTTNQPKRGTAIDEMAVDLHQGIAGNLAMRNGQKSPSPSEISKALMPDIKLRSPQRNYLQRRFDIAVKDVPARNFFAGLVTGTPISIVVSPEIKGNVTLSMKQATIEQVLQTMENVYGFAYDPIPGGYEILPNTLRTKIYPVNYLELERKSRSNMQLTSGEVLQSGAGATSSNALTGTSSSSTIPGATNTVASVIGNVETKSTVDFWKQLEKTVNSIVGTKDYKAEDRNKRQVTVNPLAGIVVVRATPKELKQVETYLDLVQNNMGRQVILEAKILEVTLSDEYQMGIDWKLFGATLNSYSDFPGTDIKLQDWPDAFNIKIKWNKSFETTIHALETQGNIQVLSSPRVATMNNQMSAIKVGNDEFFVTNVTANNNIATGSAIANPTQSVNLTPFFTGITLDVTPQINANNEVTLHIHPTVSLVKDQRKVIDLGTQGGVLDLPLANSTIRESDTIVHALNGQVVVIGGLMQNTTTENLGQMPFFGNIPFLGTLFRATKQDSKKTELVILLKPTIVDQKSMNKELTETTDEVMRLKSGFHSGSRPDVYGDEGEEPVTFGPRSGYQTER